MTACAAASELHTQLRHMSFRCAVLPCHPLAVSWARQPYLRRCCFREPARSLQCVEKHQDAGRRSSLDRQQQDAARRLSCDLRRPLDLPATCQQLQVLTCTVQSRRACELTTSVPASQADLTCAHALMRYVSVQACPAASDGEQDDLEAAWRARRRPLLRRQKRSHALSEMGVVKKMKVVA